MAACAVVLLLLLLLLLLPMLLVLRPVLRWRGRRRVRLPEANRRAAACPACSAASRGHTA